MNGIDIRFINSADSFVGRAIDWTTNSLMDHVEIGARASYADDAVTSWIGAHSDHGVQERQFDYCKPTAEWHYRIPCTEEQWATILAAARADIGVKYNFLDIGGLLFHDRRLNDPHRLICSHAAYKWVWASGIMLLNVLPEYAYLVTPETLHLSPLLIGHRLPSK